MVQHCYAGDQVQFLAKSRDIGQCLHKSMPHLIKGAKAGTTTIWEESMMLALYGM